MKPIALALTAALGLAAALPALAGPPPSASLYVVHGIPGRDLGKTVDPTLPVDVLVNGSLCLLRNLTFGTVAGPYDLPAGSYAVEVSLADVGKPCGNPALLKASVDLVSGEYAAAVAALSPAGAPTIEPFSLDFQSVRGGQERLLSVHAAAASAVKLSVTGSAQPPETASITLSPDTARADELLTQFGAGARFTVSAQQIAGTNPPTPSVTVPVEDHLAALLFLVGSQKSGSLRLIERLVPDVL